MSDHKPMGNSNKNEDMEELLRLLERMGMLDELNRYRAAAAQSEEAEAEVEEAELIDAPEEPVRREPIRFQPTEQTAVDARDLLLTDWEDPLQMSEYLVSGQEDVSLLDMFAEEEEGSPACYLRGKGGKPYHDGGLRSGHSVSSLAGIKTESFLRKSKSRKRMQAMEARRK